MGFGAFYLFPEIRWEMLSYFLRANFHKQRSGRCILELVFQNHPPFNADSLPFRYHGQLGVLLGEPWLSKG